MNIFLVPLKFFNQQLLQNIVDELSRRFTDKVSAINLNVNIDDFFSIDRQQYYSTQIIAEAIKQTENIDGKIILLTDVDIFVPALTFIFGEAQLSGKHSIVSACRLHEEFYTSVTNNILLLERIIKEILHELGHNFGLRHCIDWNCVMHASHGIEEVDIKGNSYCTNCIKFIEGYKQVY